MRILLPPSEGKSPPGHGPPLDFAALSFPTLDPARTDVLSRLVALSRDTPQDACAVLGLGPSLAPEVARNAGLREAPSAPAWQVYSGVLHAALDVAHLPAGSSPHRLVIASALFGLLAHDDPIPAYRLSGAVRLPGLATPKSLWRGPVGQLIAGFAEEGLVVDLRSQTYQWGPARPPNTVVVRIMSLRNGRPVPMSHHNKAAKGRVARTLAAAPAEPTTPAELIDLLRGAGWDARPAADGAAEVLQAHD